MSAPVSDIQRELGGLDPASPNFQQLLLQLLSHQDLKPYVQGLQEPELKEFVELLDKVSDTGDNIRRH